MRLAGSLGEALASLNELPAARWDASLQDLLHPGSLATLPLSAQANLALLLRAAPHRFTAAQREALAEGLGCLAAPSGGSAAEPQHASLPQLLAAELYGEGNSVAPACPSFLYTAEPCFPWAPVRTDADAAAALHKQLQQAARRHLLQQQQQQQEAAAAAAGKRPAGEAELGGSAAKRQRPAAPPSTQQATAAAAAAAEAELDAAAAAVKAALSGPAPLTAVPPELREALGTLLAHAAAGGPAGEAALEDAGLGSLADDGALLLLLTELVTPTSSYARSSAAAAGLLLPRLLALDAPASRDLAAAVEHVGTANPQAYIAACLRPLLSRPGLNKHQAELLSGALKGGLPAALLPDVLAAACAAPAGGGSAGSGWNEHTVGVLQAALNARPPLAAAGVAQLASAFAAATSASAELAASAKLAKLVLTVVKSYPAEAAGAKAQLAAAAAACRSFMAKSLAAAVAKL